MFRGQFSSIKIIGSKAHNLIIGIARSSVSLVLTECSVRTASDLDTNRHDHILMVLIFEQK